MTEGFEGAARWQHLSDGDQSTVKCYWPRRGSRKYDTPLFAHIVPSVTFHPLHHVTCQDKTKENIAEKDVHHFRNPRRKKVQDELCQKDRWQTYLGSPWKKG